MTTPSRHPRGNRTGGQFAATEHAEPTLNSLSPVFDERPFAGASPVVKRELMGPGALRDRNPARTPAAQRFLGEPDKLIRNPVYRNAPQMRMFIGNAVQRLRTLQRRQIHAQGRGLLQYRLLTG